MSSKEKTEIVWYLDRWHIVQITIAGVWWDNNGGGVVKITWNLWESTVQIEVWSWFFSSEKDGSAIKQADDSVFIKEVTKYKINIDNICDYIS